MSINSLGGININKTPNGIKIIVILMVILQLYDIFPPSHEASILGLLKGIFLLRDSPSFGSSLEDGFWRMEYGLRIAELIIMSLLIVAGVGLWKMKDWGLFIVLIVFGAKISINTIYLPYGFPPPIDGIYWYICLYIFYVISIIYLWKSRFIFKNLEIDLPPEKVDISPLKRGRSVAFYDIKRHGVK